jgi:aspartate/methionine/tyrosine aminotransferase
MDLKMIKSFMVMDILELAKEMERRGEKIIHMEVGEPDFDTPSAIKNYAIKALKSGEVKYTHSMGSFELREEIGNFYKRRYGISIEPEEIVVTQGSSPAMFLIFALLIEKGDKILLTNPHYPCYPNFIRFFGGIPVFIPLSEEENYQIDIKRFKKLSRGAKAIVINSPANPTGAVIEREVMEEIADSGLFVISDEIYHGLTYEGEEISMRQLTNRSFVINGFSKAFSMTGWRLGYAIFPGKFYRDIQKLQQNFFISANAFVQKAGIYALKNGWKDVERMREAFRKRRDFLVSELKKNSFPVKFISRGAFYFMLNIKNLKMKSFKFAVECLKKTKVAVAPGIDFGSRGEGFVRLSYTISIPKMKEGIQKLKEFCGEIKRGRW